MRVGGHTEWTKWEIKRGRDILLLLASLKTCTENSQGTRKSAAPVLEGEVDLLRGGLLKRARMSSVPLREFIT